jgi:hypothetical protein
LIEKKNLVVSKFKKKGKKMMLIRFACKFDKHLTKPEAVA